MSLRCNLKFPERVIALNLQVSFRNDYSRATWNERATSRTKIILEEDYETLDGTSEVPVSIQRSREELAMAVNNLLIRIDSKVIGSSPKIYPTH